MKLGYLFLGIWLILQSLIALLDLSFRYDNLIVGLLGLVAGVFVLLRK